MNYWFLAAAIISAFTCLAHIFLGGLTTAKPLLAANALKTIPKFTAYYCWHLVSITLAGIAIAFYISAGDQTEFVLAVFATSGAGAFMAWSGLMIAIFKLKVWHFPQWALFAPTTLFGIAGLWGALATNAS